MLALEAEPWSHAALELTHNWGSENDDSFQAHNGNSEPKGYGHIGLSGRICYACSNACASTFEQLFCHAHCQRVISPRGRAAR